MAPNDTYVGSANRRLCPDGHDPALATGVCTRCGFDVYGYFDDIPNPNTSQHDHQWSPWQRRTSDVKSHWCALCGEREDVWTTRRGR